jgi:hypothetical protein
MPFEDWQLSQVMGKKSKLLEDLIPLQKEENMFLVTLYEESTGDIKSLKTQEAADTLDEAFGIVEGWIKAAQEDRDCKSGEYQIYDSSNKLAFSYTFQRDSNAH